MRSAAVAWTASLFVGLSAAVPSITFPINSQVPPVARIGEPFSFVFSPSTFSSDLALTYTLDKPPRWLSIDSNARRLFGTPKADDVGPGEVEGVLVNLVATDKSGSTTHTATLVLSKNNGPKLQIPFEKQVPGFGVFSGPSSVLALPDLPFSFSLKPDTFSNPSSSPLGYYAVMDDNTPLPAWISFDPGRLSFSGRTPPFESLVQPPQRFALILVASDVVGFSGAGLGIDIVVGTHQITADQTTIILTATPGKPVSYTDLKDSVRVDGKPVTSENVVLGSISNVPPWLSVDKNTWHITGTPPETATQTNFTITLQDSFSDSLNISAMVDVSSEASKNAGLFKGDKLPTFTATAGERFSFDLGSYLADPQDTEISVSTLPEASWVLFDADKLALSGDAPKATQDSVLGVRIEAKSKSSGKLDSASLLLRVTAVGSDTRGGPVAQPSESASTGAGVSLAGDGFARGHANLTLLAALLPLSFIVFAAIVVLFWCYRRRKENQGRRRGISVRDISGPLPGTFEIKLSAPSTPPSLPAFDARNFDKSFSVNDVFVSEKNVVVEQPRSAPVPGMPSLSPSPATVRMLPSSHRSKKGGGKRGMGRMPFLGDSSFGRLASSLSSISETSLTDDRTRGNTGDDRRGPVVVGMLGKSRRRGYFRDGVEIRIPNAPSQSVTTSSETTTTTGSPSSSSLSLTNSGGSEGPDTLPLRTESRLGYHPPAAAGRGPSKRFMLSSWLRGKNVRKKMMPKLSQMPNRANNNSNNININQRHNHNHNRSNQSSVSTVDTFDYKRHSSRLTHQQQQHRLNSSASPAASSSSSSAYRHHHHSPSHLPNKTTPPPIPPPPARLVGKVHLGRPVTRRGPITKASVEGIISSGTSASTSTSTPTNNNNNNNPLQPPVTPRGGRPQPRPRPPHQSLLLPLPRHHDHDHIHNNYPNNHHHHKQQKPSLLGTTTGKKGVSLPVLPNWRDTPDEFLSLSYENLVKESPFHPAAATTTTTTTTTTSWSTIPSAAAAAGGDGDGSGGSSSNPAGGERGGERERGGGGTEGVVGDHHHEEEDHDDDDDDDGWVDETVESFASPMSLTGGMRGTEVNWKVIGSFSGLGSESGPRPGPGPGPGSSWPVKEEEEVLSIRDWDVGTEADKGLLTVASSSSIIPIKESERKGKEKDKVAVVEHVFGGGCGSGGSGWEKKNKSVGDNNNNNNGNGDFVPKGHGYSLSRGNKSLLSEASKDESDYAVYI